MDHVRGSVTPICHGDTVIIEPGDTRNPWPRSRRQASAIKVCRPDFDLVGRIDTTYVHGGTSLPEIDDRYPVRSRPAVDLPRGGRHQRVSAEVFAVGEVGCIPHRPLKGGDGLMLVEHRVTLAGSAHGFLD